MDICSLFKTVDHLLVAGNVSKDTKFNLGVVSINQRAALPRDKEFAHFSPKFSANRDILDIGFGTADAAGTGFCLVEGGVDPTVRLYRTGQADDIGAQQFGQLAIIQNLFDNGVHTAQRLQHLRIGGIAAFGFLSRRQTETVEENFSELLSRIKVEGDTRQLHDFIFQAVDLLL